MEAVGGLQEGCKSKGLKRAGQRDSSGGRDSMCGCKKERERVCVPVGGGASVGERGHTGRMN